MAKGEKSRSVKPSKAERKAIKNALKAQGFKEKNVITRLFGRDLDVSVLDDEALTREQVAEIVIAMQRTLPRGA